MRTSIDLDKIFEAIIPSQRQAAGKFQPEFSPGLS